MPFEKFDLENLDKGRRKAMANSIRTITVEELKVLGNQIFRCADDPWREAFFQFVAENSRRHFPPRSHERRRQHHLLPRQG